MPRAPRDRSQCADIGIGPVPDRRPCLAPANRPGQLVAGEGRSQHRVAGPDSGRHLPRWAGRATAWARPPVQVRPRRVSAARHRPAVVRKAALDRLVLAMSSRCSRPNLRARPCRPGHPAPRPPGLGMHALQRVRRRHPVSCTDMGTAIHVVSCPFMPVCHVSATNRPYGVKLALTLAGDPARGTNHIPLPCAHQHGELCAFRQTPSRLLQ